MDEIYKSLIALATIPPAAYLTLRLMDYGVAKFCHRVGYITEELTFSSAPRICREEERKLNEKYGIKD